MLAFMSEYRRTRIARLQIRGYRSIRDLCLEDIPPLVVMHGPNGAGKSNVLRALRLVLRAVGISEPIAANREESTVYEDSEALKTLGLRQFDFHRGAASSEIRISLAIDLGTRAQAAIGVGSTDTETASLEAVFQAVGDGRVRTWFDKAAIDGGLSLFASAAARPIRDTIRQLESTLELTRDQIAQQKAFIESQPGQASVYRINVRNLERQRESIETQIVTQRAGLSADDLRADRIRSFLGSSALQVSEAYRRVENTEGELFESMVSPNRLRLDAVKHLSERLKTAGLFGSTTPVELRPVQVGSDTQIFVNRPGIGELPLRNLGTGEQQLVLLLGQSVITPHPIALLEEPEAHLYRDHLLRLADVLRESTSDAAGPPDVDQLWMTTHHHAFAIAEEYYDVSLGDDRATRVEKRKRSEAASHFWEPGPLWDALRELVKNGLATDAVIFHDEDGKEVRAKQLDESIRVNGRLARRFAEVATEGVVRSLRKHA